MPKMKSKSAVKKRFTLTGTGKVKRHHAYMSHILTKKTKKRKRNLSYGVVADKVNEGTIKQMLGLK